MPVLACIETEKLADAEAVAIGDEDHGGIALAPTIGLGRVHQLGDLALGQVLPRPIGGIAAVQQWKRGKWMWWIIMMTEAWAPSLAYGKPPLTVIKFRHDFSG